MSFRKIGSLTAEELNHALKKKTSYGSSTYDIYNENSVAPPFTRNIGASNGASFYRVIYKTVVAETGHRERVSGLIAIPKGQGNNLPMVSWQHGTILDAKDAPSMLINNDRVIREANGVPRSAQTLLTVNKLTGNGYIVSAADYIGNGRSKATQAYGVKGATNQTILDMLKATEAVIEKLGYTSKKKMLLGTSQGGLASQWLSSALERDGNPPDRTAAVVSPTVLSSVMSYWVNDYPGEPPFLSAFVPLVLGSYEKYYGIQDLMAKAIKPEYIDTANKIYNREIDWAKVNPPTKPGEGFLGLPSKPKDMLTGSFIEEFNSGKGKFYETLTNNSALEERFSNPSRFYSGGADTVIPTAIAITLPVDHQKQLGSDLAQSIFTSPAGTHSSNFVDSLYGPLNVLDWFNAAL